MHFIHLLTAITMSLAPNDSAIVAQLDETYQAAVKANDPAGMDAILADDFVLVTGKGVSYTRAQLIDAARQKTVTYERQDPSQRTVRLYGKDVAIVTALLWEKGVSNGTPFDKKLWFSDTYVRTSSGWKYVFGQASLPLP